MSVNRTICVRILKICESRSIFMAQHETIFILIALKLVSMKSKYSKLVGTFCNCSAPWVLSSNIVKNLGTPQLPDSLLPMGMKTEENNTKIFQITPCKLSLKLFLKASIACILFNMKSNCFGEPFIVS